MILFKIKNTSSNKKILKYDFIQFYGKVISNFSTVRLILQEYSYDLLNRANLLKLMAEYEMLQ